MSLRIQWISAARGKKKGRFPFVTLKINWIGTDQPRWSFNTKNYVFDNFINFKTLWLGQKVVEILNLINRIIQTLLVRVLTVWNTSVFPEKYLLRNISVGGVVWDNSDKVWCNILEMKRMRSQGSHHHPALNKERRRQYGLCSQGDYSIDPRIYLPIEVCSTISFQSRENLIYFHYWPKLWGFPRLHSRALLSRVDSRYFAWNTLEPLICHLLCSHVENFWDIWRSRFL